MQQLTMKDQIYRQLADEAILVYIDWREESAGVWDAFDQWDSTRDVNAATGFAVYRAALDREECAARAYADLLARVAAVNGGEGLRPEAVLHHPSSATCDPTDEMP
jgi:hypothetical protein